MSFREHLKASRCGFKRGWRNFSITSCFIREECLIEEGWLVENLVSLGVFNPSIACGELCTDLFTCLGRKGALLQTSFNSKS